MGRRAEETGGTNRGGATAHGTRRRGRMERRERMERGWVGNPPYGTTGTRRAGSGRRCQEGSGRRKILRLYRPEGTEGTEGAEGAEGAGGGKRPRLWQTMDKGGALSAKSGLITRENGYFNYANWFARKRLHLYFFN